MKTDNNTLFNDRYDISAYGLESQKKQAMLSQMLFCCINMSDADDVSRTLGELVKFIENIDEYDDLQFFEGKNPLVIAERYERIIARVDGFTDTISGYQINLAKERVLLERLLEICEECGQEFEELIKKGEETLDNMKDRSLQNLLEKRIEELKTAKNIHLRQKPAISMLIKNADVVTAKVQSTLYSTIPLWKTQVTVSLSAENMVQFDANKKHLNELTNNLLVGSLNELAAIQNENRRERNEVGSMISS